MHSNFNQLHLTRISQRERQPIIWQIFCQKTAWKWKKLDRESARVPNASSPLNPPIFRSSHFYFHLIISHQTPFLFQVCPPALQGAEHRDNDRRHCRWHRLYVLGSVWDHGARHFRVPVLREPIGRRWLILIGFFTNSLQYKNSNIANFAFIFLPLEWNWTKEVCNFEM